MIRQMFPLESGRQGHRRRVAAFRALEALHAIDEFTGSVLGSVSQGTDTVYHLVVCGQAITVGARDALVYAQGVLAGFDKAIKGDQRGLRPVYEGAYHEARLWYEKTLDDLRAKLDTAQHCDRSQARGQAEQWVAAWARRQGEAAALAHREALKTRRRRGEAAPQEPQGWTPQELERIAAVAQSVYGPKAEAVAAEGYPCAVCLGLKSGDASAAARMCKAVPPGRAETYAASHSAACFKCWEKQQTHASSAEEAREMIEQFQRLEKQPGVTAPPVPD